MLPIHDDDIITRFWTKVNKVPGSCWLFTGTKNPAGYGSFSVLGNKTGAHQFSVAVKLGIWPLPKRDEYNQRLEVCHSCIATKNCVNPDHLRLDTKQSNIDDTVKQGRTAKGDANGARKHKERLVRGDAHWTRKNPEKIKPRYGDDHWMHKNPHLVKRGAEATNARYSIAQVLYVRRRWAIRDLFPITKVALGREMVPVMSHQVVRYILNHPGAWPDAVPKD